MEKDNRWAMLCKLRVDAFDHRDWRWERKEDGDRMRVDVGPETIRLMSRSGNDKTAQFPDLMQFFAFCVPYQLAPFSMDGEVVSATGLSFQEFNQRRMNRTEDVDEFARDLPAKFVAFDLLSSSGVDLRGLPLYERRKQLDDIVRRMVGETNRELPAVELSAQYAFGTLLFEKACKEGWEGVVGKDINGMYKPHGRNDWVKVKRWLEGEFECIGYTQGTGKREKLFGALVVRSLDGKLNAEVGTGFNDAALSELLEYMLARRHGARTDCQVWPVIPFKVNVKYVEVTNANSLRFPVYLGRADA